MEVTHKKIIQYNAFSFPFDKVSFPADQRNCYLKVSFNSKLSKYDYGNQTKCIYMHLNNTT